MFDLFFVVDEVWVEICVVGLNLSDVKNVFGCFFYIILFWVLGCDFVGVVVEGLKVLFGQVVWGIGWELGFFCDGSYVQFLILLVVGVVFKLESLSFVQVVSCGVFYSIVWDVL